jgi:site-specific DNA recombinase
MQVALYGRVSTTHQEKEGTIASQVTTLKQFIAQRGWSLLAEHEFLDEGFSGSRFDRPALDRLRDAARRGEFDAAVVLSPDRLARNYAHQWLLIEEFEKLGLQWIFLQNPFGDTPQGKLLTQMQGMMAEYERAQILERTRRGRLEKARRGQYIPWAYHCYGYEYLPKRQDSPPRVLIQPTQAENVRRIFRLLLEEQLSCRQITKRLNESHTPPPSGRHPVWHPGSVRNILTNRTYAGQARYNYRVPAQPQYRRTGAAKLHQLKTGRNYRAPTEWVWSPAPALITEEMFAKAQEQLRRNAELARRRYQPSHHRHLLRCLVKCGECGLGMDAVRQCSAHKRYEYLYYCCKGRSPLSCGRLTKCSAHNVRADRLDQVVWQALCELLRNPRLIPQLHESWAKAKQHSLNSLSAQQEQLLQRQQRLERQDQRLVDAYQTEVINLEEFKTRREQLSGEREQIQQQRHQLTRTEQENHHWQKIIEHAETFSHLLGQNLDQLSFEERQTVAQCLIRKVVVTGDQVDIFYALPFALAPQVCQSRATTPEGAPSGFYRLRLAHRGIPALWHT